MTTLLSINSIIRIVPSHKYLVRQTYHCTSPCITSPPTTSPSFTTHANHPTSSYPNHFSTVPNHPNSPLQSQAKTPARAPSVSAGIQTPTSTNPPTRHSLRSEEPNQSVFAFFEFSCGKIISLSHPAHRPTIRTDHAPIKDTPTTPNSTANPHKNWSPAKPASTTFHFVE